MKAGPKQSQFEPSEGKAVLFTDVHGVDEAKEVKQHHMLTFIQYVNHLVRNSKMLSLS